MDPWTLPAMLGIATRGRREATVTGRDIISGVDAGTSVMKAVAFEFAGRQLAVASIPNRYAFAPDGSATQSLTLLASARRTGPVAARTNA